jgi:hypothetical protein
MQQWSVLGLQAGIALMAWVSLQPYFLWGHQKAYYVAASLLIVVCGAANYRLLLARRERWLLCVAFAFFLVYLSALPKVDGSVTRWFFLIPFTAAALQLGHEQLKPAFESFYWMFSLSLLPGMAAWLWIVAGLPIEMQFTAPPGEIVQRGVTEYLKLPGAVFLLSNGIVLPNGGALFRLCGMYDEPGTVGTIAALCLAASGFRLRSVPGAIALVAGAMSFSIAFALLSSLGLLASALAQRRFALLAALPLSALAAALPLSGIKFESTPPSRITIVMPKDMQWESLGAPQAPAAKAPYIEPGARELFAPAPQWGLRNAPGVDSRTQPGMRQLLHQYLSSPLGVLLFGIAADASIIHGWGSSIWYRVLTDFGVVGLVWLFFLFAYPLVQLWREQRLHAPSVIFCGLFLMSFYQRPIIWLPAQLLLYLAGLYLPKKSART